MKAFLREQWWLLQLSISFFSRMPVSKSIPFTNERMKQSHRYFPVVGLIIAAFSIAAWSLAAHVLPNDVAICLFIIAGMLCTGALHEDGLADMADGLGGGNTVEMRLSIMKDSRIGSYGAATLVLLLLTKYTLLTHLSESLSGFTLSVVLAFSISRLFALSIMWSLPYVSAASASKSQNVVDNAVSPTIYFYLAYLIIFSFLTSFSFILLLCLILVVIRQAFISWFNARLGGYTGDCLGAVQQVNELVILSIVLAWGM